MSSWVEGRVVDVRRWTDNLYSLRVHAPEVTFTAGQFAKLALPAAPGAKEPMLGRPYSFVNPPGTPVHEFYFVVVPEGPLSPRLAALVPGDRLWLLARANGFFTIDEVPTAPSLWCLATGTGLGPFLSILRTAAPWQKFARVVLVHAVRYARELVYAEEIADVARTHPDAFRFVPVVSREDRPGGAARAHSGAPLDLESDAESGGEELSHRVIRAPGKESLVGLSPRIEHRALEWKERLAFLPPSDLRRTREFDTRTLLAELHARMTRRAR